MPTPATTFAEIRSVAESLPSFDAELRHDAQFRLGRMADIEGDPGVLGKLAAWLAGAQRNPAPRVNHPRLALFAATHGLAADLAGGSAEALRAHVAKVVEGGGALHRLTEAADADLRLYELALEQSSADSRAEPAMDEIGTARAVAYGMMAVEPGLDLLIVSALGIGADLSAAALEHALSDEACDPLTTLAARGGADSAAILGVILAASLAGVPVILDGKAARAAGKLAARLRTGAADHCVAASASSEAATPMLTVLPFAIDPPLAGAAALPLLRAAASLLG